MNPVELKLWKETSKNIFSNPVPDNKHVLRLGLSYTQYKCADLDDHWRNLSFYRFENDETWYILEDFMSERRHSRISAVIPCTTKLLAPFLKERCASQCQTGALSTKSENLPQCIAPLARLVYHTMASFASSLE